MIWAARIKGGPVEVSQALVYIASLFALSLTILFSWARRRRGELPPGPRRLPLLGNLHQFPRVDMRHTLAKWHKKYGPILGIKLGPRTVIVVGSHAVAKDLFGFRGRIYSSRPRMAMASECMNRSMQTSLIPYGERWKLHNRIQLSLIGQRKVGLYEGVIQLAAVRVLWELQRPKQQQHHNHHHELTFNRYLFSVIFALAYGLRLEDCEVEFQEILDIADSFTEALANGQWAVDVFPALNHLPRCFAPWKKVGDRLYTRAVAWFEKNTVAGLKSNSWNWSKEVHTQENMQHLAPVEIRHLVGVLFEAGVDSVATVLSFFLSTCSGHPDVVRRAQAEIDELVGAARLPSLADLRDLPYVAAVIKEVLRWRPVAPEGLPHETTEANQYGDYTIPRGVTVIFSHWTAQMDEAVFTDPLIFRPERWLDPATPQTSAFGYGRRACPGQWLARMALDVLIPRLLWAFDFEVSGGNRGAAFDPCETVQTSATMKPAPFSATFRPRSEQRKQIIDQAYTEAMAADLDQMLERIGEAFSQC